MLRNVAGFRQQLGESAGALAAVFRNPDLRRVELAWTMTMLAQWAYFVGLAVYAYERGGATAVGLVTIIRTIPAAAASPVLSVLADRYRRDLVLISSTAARAVLIAGAALLVFADMNEFTIYALAALMSVAGTVIRPAQSAMLPSLARTPGELTAANVTTSTIESVGQFIGPAIGGLLLAATDTGVVFLAVAGAFAASALLVSRLETSQQRPAPIEDEGGSGFGREITAGMRAIGSESRLRVLVALSGTQTMVAGAFSVLIVAAALDLLDIGEVGVGYLNSAVGIGGLAGAFLALGLAGRNRLASNFGVGMFIWGIPIVLIGVYPESAVAIALLIVIGAGNTIVDVSGLTLMQRAVRDDILGRVFGALEGLMIITVGLGAMLAPLLIELIGIRGALMVTGALLPLLTALLWRGLAGIDELGRVPLARIDLLREIPIFSPLPAATLEYLAGSLVEHRRSAGEVIFRQGDEGDRYYVVAEGRVEVEVDGQPAGQLGRAQGFGEIALLKDVPRTATVTAVEDVTLLSLARDQFIGAVTGHAPSAAAADAVVSSRLDRLSPRIATV